jgi:hypothetical protein
MSQRGKNKRVKNISSALSELQQPEIPGASLLGLGALLGLGCLDRLMRGFGLDDVLLNILGAVPVAQENHS